MSSTFRTSRWFSSFLVLSLVFGLLSSLAVSPRIVQADAVNPIKSPGFEEDTVWTDWTYDGTPSSAAINAASRSGAKALEYFNASPYRLTFSQTVTGLEPGSYALRAWAMGDDKSTNTFNLFSNDSVGKKTTAIDNGGWQVWSQYEITGIVVTGGQATVGFEIDAPGGVWGVIDDFELVKVASLPTWSAGKSLTASTVEATSVTLDWSGVDGSGDIVGYQVYKDGALIGSPTATTFSVTELSPDTAYDFKVEAVNSAGLPSMDGPTITITTDATTATAPTWGSDSALQANQLTSRGVVLAWPAAEDAAGVTKYRVYANGQEKATVSGSVYSYYANDLKPGTAYTFKVEAGNDSSLWSGNGPSASLTTPQTPSGDFVKGADVSTLQAIEDAGGKYYDAGTQRDLLAILKDRGVNYVRLRIWNDPVQAGGYNDKARTVAMAKRVKDAGLKLLLDFHYSDFWTDPGSQVKPAAWANLSFNDLKDAMYDYTEDVLNSLNAVGAYPDMVQIGNEINPGMLLPDGSTSNYNNLAQLLSTGIKAVRDTTPAGHEVKTMIHLAEGGNNGLFRGYFDALTTRNVDFDVIGLSFYPYWHGTYKNLKDNLNDLAARYGKQLIVVETAHPYTLDDGDGWGNIAQAADADKAGFPATPQGQYDAFTMIMNTVAHTNGGKGAGAFYWEPAWIPVAKAPDGDYQAGWKIHEGNAWDNQAMFDFQGNALSSLDAYRFEASRLPVKSAVKAINPEGITVSANLSLDEMNAKLPGTVGVLYNEGSIEQKAVTWQAIDPDRLSRIGTFALNGTVADAGLSAKVVITVTSYRNLATNPGFEAASTLTGWTVEGTNAAAKVDNSAGNAYSGTRSLNYWYGSDYAYSISQTVTGLPDGYYTLKAKAAGGGGETTLRLFADGYGGDKLTSTNIVNTGWNVWGTYAIEHIRVTNGQAVIGIEVAAPAEVWGNFDDIEFYREVSVPTWTPQASVTVSERTTSSIKLQWSGIADGVAATGYKVYKDGQLLATVGGDSYTATNLRANASYVFTVEASADGSIWTGDGPSVTASTTQETSNAVSLPPQQQKPGSVHIIPPGALSGSQGNRAEINVAEGATEIRIPADASKLLGGKSLALNYDNVKLEVPAKVLAQLASGDGYIAITAIPHAASERLVAQAAHATGATIIPSGTVYDFGLAFVSANGETTKLNSFAEPITLRFTPSAGFDADLGGVYYIQDDGKLAYIGGTYENGMLTAQANHFSAYAVLQVSRTFADVPAAHWASKAIASLASKLIVAGTGDNRFEPERAVTRAEFATMLSRSLRLPTATKASPFKDVPSTASYAEAIHAAYAAGIVQGTGKGASFAPNRTITRQEMAVMVLRAYHYLRPEAAPVSDNALLFADAARIESWAKPAVEQTVSLGLLKGRDGDRFAPMATLTRAEAAQVAFALLKVR
ncbi:MAG: glycosyl hydrolase 53 family protein [Cohnella sp.]|nr:glycosyl hydrolase 53 family protein [Cohnella sp.]